MLLSPFCIQVEVCYVFPFLSGLKPHRHLFLLVKILFIKTFSNATSMKLFLIPNQI